MQLCDQAFDLRVISTHFDFLGTGALQIETINIEKYQFLFVLA